LLLEKTQCRGQTCATRGGSASGFNLGSTIMVTGIQPAELGFFVSSFLALERTYLR
jgi:hypothetical protein